MVIKTEYEKSKMRIKEWFVRPWFAFWSFCCLEWAVRLDQLLMASEEGVNIFSSKDYIYVVERNRLRDRLESLLLRFKAETVRQKQNAWKRRNPPKVAIQMFLYWKIQLTSLSLHPCL